MRDDDRRVLDEVDDLVKGTLGHVGLKAELLLYAGNLLFYRGCALLGAGDDLHSLEVREELVGTCHFNRLRRQETMTVSGAPCMKTRELHIYDICAKQSHKPANRTGEGVATCAPALGARPRQAADEVFQNAREQFLGFLGRFGHNSVDVLIAVFIALAQEIGDIKPLAAGKARCCLGRVAVRIERDLCRRPLGLDLDGLGGGGEVCHRQDHAARRRARLYLAMGKTCSV